MKCIVCEAEIPKYSKTKRETSDGYICGLCWDIFYGEDYGQ